MPLRQRSRQFVGSLLLLTFLLSACNLTQIPEPTSTETVSPTFALPSSSTAPLTPKAVSTPILPTLTPNPVPLATLTPRPSGGQLALFGSEPDTLDPALAGDANSHEYIGKIFSGLVRMTGNLEILPDIAERWQVDDSGTVYTFYLRENVKFHNGRAVTAHDIKYSIERACDPETGRGELVNGYLNDIVGAWDKFTGDSNRVSGVRVLDDYTLGITINEPRALFLAKLTYPTSFVVDKNQVEGASSDWWQEANGTGPFSLEQFDDESITLKADDDFYRGRPSLDKVIYRLTGGGAVAQYERGQIDVAPVGSADIDRVLDPANPLHDDLVIIHSLDTFYLAFNTAMPPFDDPKVRLAFAYATNKKALADIIFNKMVEPAAGILPPDMPGYNENLDGIPFNPDKALDLLLDESDYAGDLPPVLYTVSGLGGPGAMAEALAESYRQILDVDVEIQATSWTNFLESLDEQQLQMFSLGWIADYPDPENFLDLLFHSQSEYNHMAYNNPEVDALLEQARIEPDIETRLGLYQRVEEILVWDVAWIPLYHGIDYQVVKPYVNGLVTSPQGFYFLEGVWIESH